MKKNCLLSLVLLLVSIATFFPAPVYGASFAASKFKLNPGVVQADGLERIKCKVTVRDSENNIVTGSTIFAASDRDTECFYEMDAENPKEPCAAGSYYYSFTDEDNDGTIEFQVSSILPGQARIAAGFTDRVFDYLVRDDLDGSDAQIIGFGTVNFTSGEAKDIQLVKLKGDQEYNFQETAAGNRIYKIKKNMGQTLIYPTADNSDCYEVAFKVTNAAGLPVSGVDVNYSLNQISARIEYDTVTTDDDGKVKVYVYSTEVFYSGMTQASELQLDVEIEEAEAAVMLNFDPGKPDWLELHMSTPNNQVIAKKQQDKKFEFYIYDTLDNKIKYSTAAELEEDIDWEVIEHPEDSNIEDNITIVPNSMTNRQELTISSFDKVGFYTIRVELRNGTYLDVNMTVKEQGEITALTLEYEEKAIALGSKTCVPTVTRIDAEGVAYELTENEIESDISFGSSDSTKLVSISSKGELTIVEKSDEEDFSGELLITAGDREKGLSASYLLYVEEEANNINLIAPTITKPGDTAKVTLQVINEKGNVVSLGQNMASKYPKISFNVLSKPEGASVKTDDGSMFSSKMNEEGSTDLEFACNKEGLVRVLVTLEVKYTDGTEYKFMKAVEVEFGLKKANFSDEARMYIGVPAYYLDERLTRMDAAPFIENDRTYVPLRAVADILGAEVQWNNETQEIILKNQEKQIYLTVGSNIVRPSDSAPLMADGAPIVIEGRTYVPFRVIGEVFGALVEPILDDANNVTGVQFRMYEEEE